MIWALTLALAASPGVESFATSFDPGNGVDFGASVLARQGSASQVGSSFSGAILLRTERPSRSKERSLWLREQRLLETRADPDPRMKEILATGYQGFYRRHLEEGFLLIPTSEPIRLPFPFDVAVSVSLARYERRVWEGPGYTLELGRAALLLDPLRSTSGRFRLAFGPAISYGLRNDGVATVQDLAPFTQGQLEALAETADGWWDVRASGLAGWVYPIGAPSLFRARGSANVERILVAVNDQPIYATLGLFGSLNDAGVHRATEWGATLGLTVRPGSRD